MIWDLERTISRTYISITKSSCGVAANHEALSRLRLGFESRQEHTIN